MKSLNRAIARTVSQIARHAGEGCHVPMIMALENHLDALLTMERKMLEGVQEVAGSVLMPPAPDVIDMTDPANWQVGDIVVRIAPTFGPMFDMGHGYIVSKIDAARELAYINTNDEVPFEYPFGLLRRDPPFEWISHGEVQS